MTRPLHDLISRALDTAQIWDRSNTGVDVPEDLFDVLIAEGAAEKEPLLWGARYAVVVVGGCKIAIIGQGEAGCFVVHCQNVDCYTHQLSAHDRLRIAASRAKTEQIPSDLDPTQAPAQT